LLFGDGQRKFDVENRYPVGVLSVLCTSHSTYYRRIRRKTIGLAMETRIRYRGQLLSHRTRHSRYHLTCCQRASTQSGWCVANERYRTCFARRRHAWFVVGTCSSTGFSSRLSTSCKWHRRPKEMMSRAGGDDFRVRSGSRMCDL
jgi:hypothetical protein